MIQRCILYFLIIGFISCNVKESDQLFFKELESKIEKSKVLVDKIGFFQMVEKSQLVSDSLLISISGFSGISIYNIISGEQIDFVNTISDPKRSLIFSSFDASEFPDIYLLESKRKMIYVYNFDKKTFTRSFRLDLDNITAIPIFGGNFKVHQDKFFIELNTEGTSLLDSEYYKKTGNFIGVFDINGKQIKRVIKYPKELTHPKYHFVPNNYHYFNIDGSKLYICFPFEKSIRVYDLNGDYEKYSLIPLPIKENMTLDLIEIPQQFNPQLIPVEQRQISAKVTNLIVENGSLYLSFGINENEKIDQFRKFVTVFQLELEQMNWSIQKENFDVFELGEFVGLSQDKFVFFDSFLKTKDEKVINFVTLE